MPRKIPQVRQYMTAAPHTVGAKQPLKEVQQLMHEFQVRHLPVEKSGKLVGIVSDRNLKEALATEEGKRLTAEDVMMPSPFHVGPEVPLVNVAAAMAEEKYGCALVQEQDGTLVGIFTTVDACRALRQILETIYPE